MRRARLATSIGVLRTAARLSRASSRVADFASSFATRAVHVDDRTALTVAIYDQAPASRRQGLFAWEHEWLGRDLPPAPARVLLGGAGQGRETRWLVDRGYHVVAFEPAREAVSKHIAACPGTPCYVLDYQALAQSTGAAAEAIRDHAPYDAALLGWGSLTHVLDEPAQEALFEALAELVPRGPLLASFFMGDARPVGRAGLLGARVADLLGRSQEPWADAERVRCLPHAGFAYSFQPSRLEQLARSAKRKLVLHAGASYPHATFR